MPDFNQTGPMGQGPKTGRKMGRCTNFGANVKNQTTETEEKTNENLQGRGLGRGRGGQGLGLGRQNRFRGGSQQ